LGHFAIPASRSDGFAATFTLNGHEMIAVDTSSLIAYLAGDSGGDVIRLDRAMADRNLLLPPPVISEILSAPKLAPDVAERILALPRIEIVDGYWERAGKLRATVLAMRCKARFADALIAQACLDHGLLIIVRDRDFRHFAAAADLVILPR